MRGTLAAAIGAVLLLGALVVTAPAALLDSRLAALSAGRLRMADASGTLWNGSGDLVALPSGSRQPLRWQLELWPLLRGEVRAAVATGAEAAPNTTFVYGRDRFELRGLDVSMPVESVLRTATAAKIARSVGGNLRLHVDHLQQRSDTLDGQLTLQWDDASVPGPGADARIALGSVRVDLSGRDSSLTGPLRNSGGEVEIEGQVSLAADGTARIDATLRPRERSDSIAAALSTLGPPDGQGGYRLSFAGSWR